MALILESIGGRGFSHLVGGMEIFSWGEKFLGPPGGGGLKSFGLQGGVSPHSPPFLPCPCLLETIQFSYLCTLVLFYPAKNIAFEKFAIVTAPVERNLPMWHLPIFSPLWRGVFSTMWLAPQQNFMNATGNENEKHNPFTTFSHTAVFHCILS